MLILLQWSGWLPLSEWAEDWRARDGSHGTEHRKSFLRFPLTLLFDGHLTLTHLYCPELGCDVVGLVSSPRRPTPHVSRYYTIKDLSEMMAGQDYLINVLPATAETNNILNRCIQIWCDENCCCSRDNLKHCKDVGFVNIGRGNIISAADILYALDNNFFRGAVVDVFDVEPLPQDSPLWAHKNILSMNLWERYFCESNFVFCSHASCCWRVESWGCCRMF